MKLKKFIRGRRDLKKIPATEKELDDLLRLVERDLRDANLESLSLDRRFATAYGAALNLARYVVWKRGVRVTGCYGNHYAHLSLVTKILGADAKKFQTYFNRCRVRRNNLDYRYVGCVSEKDLSVLIEVVNEFRAFILIRLQSELLTRRLAAGSMASVAA